jgi:hypothetical protein
LKENGQGTDSKKQKIPNPFGKGLGLKVSHFSQRLSLSLNTKFSGATSHLKLFSNGNLLFLTKYFLDQS